MSALVVGLGLGLLCVALLAVAGVLGSQVVRLRGELADLRGELARRRGSTSAGRRSLSVTGGRR